MLPAAAATACDWCAFFCPLDAVLLTMCVCAGGMRQARVAVLIGVTTVALMAMVVLAGKAASPRTVLDDVVDDPLADMDDTPHEWADTHGDGYDPEKQNILATDEDAFTVPFVGYAKKDLKWRAPAEPETNALDYLPTV
jgi:hypothetical protein